MKIAELPVLSEEQRDDAAFRAKDLGWAAVVRLFDHYADTQKLSYQKLGERIKRSRSHVQRWLASPFNLSLSSLGLLAEGLDADLVISLKPRRSPASGINICHPSQDARGTLISRSLLTRCDTTTVPNSPPSPDKIPSSSEPELTTVVG